MLAPRASQSKPHGFDVNRGNPSTFVVANHSKSGATHECRLPCDLHQNHNRGHSLRSARSFAEHISSKNYSQINFNATQRDS